LPNLYGLDRLSDEARRALMSLIKQHGDISESLSSLQGSVTGLSNTVSTLGGTVQQQGQQISSLQSAVNTKASVTYGTTAPQNPNEGDVWCYTGGEHVVVYVYSNSQWVEVANNIKDFSELSGYVTEAQLSSTVHQLIEQAAKSKPYEVLASVSVTNDANGRPTVLNFAPEPGQSSIIVRIAKEGGYDEYQLGAAYTFAFDGQATGEHYIYFDVGGMPALIRTSTYADCWLAGRGLVAVCSWNNTTKKLSVLPVLRKPSLYISSDVILANAITSSHISTGSVDADRLTTSGFFISGCTFTQNGSQVSWTSCKVMYQGTYYSISSGSTTNRYIYWVAGSPSFSSTNSIDAINPFANPPHILIAINDGVQTRVVHNATVVTGNMIQTAAVRADHIQAGAVTADKINVSRLSAISADLGTVTAGKMSVSRVSTKYSSISPSLTSELPQWIRLTGAEHDMANGLIVDRYAVFSDGYATHTCVFAISFYKPHSDTTTLSFTVTLQRNCTSGDHSVTAAIYEFDRGINETLGTVSDGSTQTFSYSFTQSGGYTVFIDVYGLVGATPTGGEPPYAPNPDRIQIRSITLTNVAVAFVSTEVTPDYIAFSEGYNAQNTKAHLSPDGLVVRCSTSNVSGQTDLAVLGDAVVGGNLYAANMYSPKTETGTIGWAAFVGSRTVGTTRVKFPTDSSPAYKRITTKQGDILLIDLALYGNIGTYQTIFYLVAGDFNSQTRFQEWLLFHDGANAFGYLARTCYFVCGSGTYVDFWLEATSPTSHTVALYSGTSPTVYSRLYIVKLEKGTKALSV